VISACRIACAIWRGKRHQLPLTIPRSPGIISVVLSTGFSGRCASTVLSRNEEDSAKWFGKRKALFFTTFAQRKTVSNLGANILTGCSPSGWPDFSTENSRTTERIQRFGAHGGKISETADCTDEHGFQKRVGFFGRPAAILSVSIRDIRGRFAGSGIFKGSAPMLLRSG